MSDVSLPNPLHQFEVKNIIPLEIAGIDISFTNASFFMLASAFFIILFMYLGVLRSKTVPTRIQAICELAYGFIEKMLDENIGSRGKNYFSFIFAIFFFILLGNLLGMFPYSYTFTSQIIVTFALAMIVFLLTTLVGIIKHGWRFLTLFVPKGLPIFLYPLIVIIELLSYLSRPITLSVRLFANMMAGHTILKVFAGFSVVLGGYFGVGPGAFTVLLIGFEFMVAILQAYVFAVLTCIYLHDALYLH